MTRSGIQAEERITNVLRFKTFIEEHNSVADRVTRAGKNHITNELYQMILVTLDSHV